jgi:hypothetical protein
MKKLENHELAEIILPANTTQSKFYFPDMPNLKDSRTFGLQVYTVDQLPVSPNNGNALPSKTQVLNNCFLTLADANGREFLKDIPAVLFNTLVFDLNTSTNLRENNAKILNGQVINWNKSFIRFSAALGNVVPLSFLLSINYVGKGQRIGCTN